MAVDIIDLMRFYESAPGRHVVERLQDDVRAVWPACGEHDAVLAYGYAMPLMEGLWQAATPYYLMPAMQGAPRHGSRSAFLAHENLWPVRSDSINRLIVMHGLEAATQADRMMQQCHRVLVPNGRALFIAPNRRGFWARSETTPFGTGRPYSAGQLRQLMRQNGLVPGLSRPTLLPPPALAHRLPAALRPVEKMIAAIVPQLAGLWVMEAIKQVPAPLSVKQAMRRRKLAAVRPAVISPKL